MLRVQLVTNLETLPITACGPAKREMPEITHFLVAQIGCFREQNLPNLARVVQYFSSTAGG